MAWLVTSAILSIYEWEVVLNKTEVFNYFKNFS